MQTRANDERDCHAELILSLQETRVTEEVEGEEDLGLDAVQDRGVVVRPREGVDRGAEGFGEVARLVRGDLPDERWMVQRLTTSSKTAVGRTPPSLPWSQDECTRDWGKFLGLFGYADPVFP